MAAEPKQESAGVSASAGARPGANGRGAAGARASGAPATRASARRRAAIPVPRPRSDDAGGGVGAQARVVLGAREPVFDHATSHVLVTDRALAGRPIGGRKPGHLAEPGSVRLRLARIGPWSAFKLALLFGTLGMVAAVSALVVLYSLLGAVGILDGIQKLVNSSGVGHHFRFDGGWIFARVVWVAAAMVLVGAAVAACMTVLYNSLADLTGGLDVTFTEHPDTVFRAPEAPTWTTRFRGMRLWRQDREDPAPEDLPKASGL